MGKHNNKSENPTKKRRVEVGAVLIKVDGTLQDIKVDQDMNPKSLTKFIGGEFAPLFTFDEENISIIGLEDQEAGEPNLYDLPAMPCKGNLIAIKTSDDSTPIDLDTATFVKFVQEQHKAEHEAIVSTVVQACSSALSRDLEESEHSLLKEVVTSAKSFLKNAQRDDDDDNEDIEAYVENMRGNIRKELDNWASAHDGLKALEEAIRSTIMDKTLEVMIDAMVSGDDEDEDEDDEDEDDEGDFSEHLYKRLVEQFVTQHGREPNEKEAEKLVKQAVEMANEMAANEDDEDEDDDEGDEDDDEEVEFVEVDDDEGDDDN